MDRNSPSYWKSIGDTFRSGLILLATLFGAMSWGISAYWANKSVDGGKEALPQLVKWTLIPCLGILLIETFSYARELILFSRDWQQAFTRERIERRRERRAMLRNVARSAQKRAFDAAVEVYGFYLVRRSHHFSIRRKDGSGTCIDELTFRSQRRALGRWDRTTLYDTNAPVHSSKITCHSAKHRFELQGKPEPKPNGSQMELTESFAIIPTIRNGEQVKATFVDQLPAKSVEFQLDPEHPKRTTDFVSAVLYQPAKRLVLKVTFHDATPDEPRLPIEADAVYGAGATEQLRESIEASELLVESDKDAEFFTATLAVPYPMMGVTYRIKWNLVKPPEPAKAQLTTSEKKETPGLIQPGDFPKTVEER